MAVTSASINIEQVAGTDTWTYHVLVNPTLATGGSSMTDAVTSAGGFFRGMQKAQESLKNVIQSANW